MINVLSISKLEGVPPIHSTPALPFVKDTTILESNTHRNATVPTEFTSTRLSNSPRSDAPRPVQVIPRRPVVVQISSISTTPTQLSSLQLQLQTPPPQQQQQQQLRYQSPARSTTLLLFLQLVYSTTLAATMKLEVEPWTPIHSTILH
jgi:hypothetical protein